MTHALTFDAVSEATPGPKWQARWHRSWPAYEAWFRARGGDSGPDRTSCEAALDRYMPELRPVHAALTRLAGNGDRAARFLSAWCPPAYLGGCSLIAKSDGAQIRLVRNYDLSPDLNEGLLLHSHWGTRPVMGMVEFLWGLSDGINGDGLSVALAFGGDATVARGFGICVILRYVLETCADVPAALRVLKRVPSHMNYNLVLADRQGRVASVEMIAGGGLRQRTEALATNHQHGDIRPDRPAFTKTFERHDALRSLLGADGEVPHLVSGLRQPPLFQENYAGGFGTLFTAEYDPAAGAVTLHWPTQSWRQTFKTFDEGTRHITYDAKAPVSSDWIAALRPWLGDAAERFDEDWERMDWAAFGVAFAARSWPSWPGSSDRSGDRPGYAHADVEPPERHRDLHC